MVGLACNPSSRDWGRRVVNVSQPELHSEWWISLRSREILSPKPSTGALVLLSVAGETLHQTQLGEKRIHFRLHFQVTISHPGKSGQGLKQELGGARLTVLLLLALSQPAYIHACACTHKHTNKCNLEIKRTILNWVWWYLSFPALRRLSRVVSSRPFIKCTRPCLQQQQQQQQRTPRNESPLIPLWLLAF